MRVIEVKVDGTVAAIAMFQEWLFTDWPPIVRFAAMLVKKCTERGPLCTASHRHGIPRELSFFV